MTHLKLFFSILLCLPLVGCASLYREVRYPGGASGHLYDKRTFDASYSKQVQLYRATLLTAMVSRLGTSTIRDEDDGEVFSKYLDSTSVAINSAAAHIYKPEPEDTTKGPCGVANKEATETSKTMPFENPGECTGYFILFESELPLIEDRLFRLTIAALPDDQIDEFVSNAASGNVIGAAFKAVQIALNTTEGLRRGAAVYRTGLEGLAANVHKDSNANCANFDGYKESEDSLVIAASCLGLDQAGLGEKHTGELREDDLKVDISKESFEALFQIISTSCAMMPVGTVATQASESPTRLDKCKELEFNPKSRYARLIAEGKKSTT